MIVNELDFFRLTSEFTDIPLYQSVGYFRMKDKANCNKVFIIDDIDEPKVACWGRVKKLPIVGTTFLQISSLCYNSAEEKDIVLFLQELALLNYDIIEITDDNLYSTSNERAFRCAGFRRPIGQFGTSLTVMVNLLDCITYARSFRRNIKIALKGGVKVEFIDKPDDEILSKISQLFIENSSSKNLSYHYTKHDLTSMLSDGNFKLFIASNNDHIIAARVIFLNKDKAMDVCTANGIKSRELRGVTQALIDGIFDYLQTNSIKTFDFSRIPIGRKGAEGVCEFKNGVNGDLAQFNGVWMLTKRNIYRQGMYMLNKYVIKKYEY